MNQIIKDITKIFDVLEYFITRLIPHQQLSLNLKVM